MLIWVIVFLVIAMIAKILGFKKIINASVYIAQSLFVIFIILFILKLVFDIEEITLIEL